MISVEIVNRYSGQSLLLGQTCGCTNLVREGDVASQGGHGCLSERSSYAAKYLFISAPAILALSV
jgi:hypothetical protein